MTNGVKTLGYILLLFIANYVMTVPALRVQREDQTRIARAAESTARAQWQQVYWLRRQAEALQTPCCMCE